ncbi:MAG: hypothetical protein MUO26_01855 [Methanotrichaceae archaeon]|nr:hypothetical protein [Methanotrichaceae archaeon]
MPDEGAGAGSQGDVGSQAGSAGSIDWSKGGVEHFAGFKESLGDLAKDKSLEPIKDFHGLTKSFVESQKMIGSSIRLPPKDMKPEDRQKAVGELVGRLRKEGVLESVPESPDKYEIKMPEIEGWKVNESLFNSFRESAHKLGVTPSHAQGLFDWYLNIQEESNAKSQVEFETMKRGLKKEFGGLYPRKMEAARRAVAKYFGEDGDNIISQLPPAVGRKMVLAFSEIGDPMLEDSLMSGGIPGVVTKEQIKAKIDSMFDPKHPLQDISNRGHKEAVEEYSKLQQQYIGLGGK